MNITQKHFLEYLGSEEQNLLTGMVNFRSEFEFFSAIDSIYQAPLARLRADDEDALVPQLYLFVHFHLYFGVSCLLRAHLSEALSSVRKAIDAGLTAYKLILEPEKAQAYLERDKYFLYIKARIQKEREKDKASYPLAVELLRIHDACSEYGSHADIGSFFHRLEIREEGDRTEAKVLVHYFQFPKNPEEYRFYFFVVLQAFFLIFKIFKVYFDRKLKIIDPEWEKKIAKLGPTLEQQRQTAYKRFSTDA